MLKQLGLPLIATLLSLSALAPVKAETVMEQVTRTGTFQAGTRSDALPFGFQTPDGALGGYGVDLIGLIGAKLSQSMGKGVTIDMHMVDVNSRFTEIESGELDIVCGATTVTRERMERVGFSVPFFISGAKFLIKQEDIETFNVNTSLEDTPIAYIEGTTTFDILPRIYPLANWVPVYNRQEGIILLDAGKVTAVVSDGILLVGELIKENKDPGDYALGPYQPITSELYACILPKGDTEWKKFVDEVIASEENHELLQQWFNVDQRDVVRVDPR